MILVEGPSPVPFLIDFGLAQQYRDPATYLHTPYNPHDPIVGTLAFSSINGQQRGTQSHHNDLESFAYTLIYSELRELPWTGCRNSKAVLQKKLETPLKQLCQGLPTPFCNFVIYVQELDFDKKPDYQHLHVILSLCLETQIDQPIKVPLSVHAPVNTEHMPVVCGRV